MTLVSGRCSDPASMLLPSVQVSRCAIPPPDQIIFDCDGVLIDSEIISAGILIEKAARHGVALSHDYVRDHFLGRSFPTAAQVIRDRFHVILPADPEAIYRARLLQRFETDLRPTPGIVDLLPRISVCR